MDRLFVPVPQGHRLFQRRAGPARFERRPTIMNLRELLVGRRGEAPLVPPYILPSFKKALALPVPPLTKINGLWLAGSPSI